MPGGIRTSPLPSQRRLRGRRAERFPGGGSGGRCILGTRTGRAPRVPLVSGDCFPCRGSRSMAGRSSGTLPSLPCSGRGTSSSRPALFRSSSRWVVGRNPEAEAAAGVRAGSWRCLLMENRYAPATWGPPCLGGGLAARPLGRAAAESPCWSPLSGRPFRRSRAGGHGPRRPCSVSPCIWHRGFVWPREEGRRPE